MDKEDQILGICRSCHLGIRYVDDYVEVKEHIKGMLKSTNFFHRECYRDTFNPLNQVNLLAKQAQKIISEVNN